MLKQLKKYYEDNGISAINFNCKHEEICRGSCADFTTAKEAFVGSEYEKGSIPRLLFLSLDSGGGCKDPQNRTIEKVSEIKPGRDVSKFHKGRHWYKTHELALKLLEQFSENLSIDNIADYFAHTNSAKCCMNKERRKMANERLFSNCREYLSGEIAIFQPDILVTQGKMAQVAIEKSYTGKIEDTESSLDVNDLCKFKVVEISDRHNALWIPTDHPSYFKRFWKQYHNCWSIYENEVMEFMKRNR
ncbi:MAG: hypothetical protein HQ568_05060 [Calditrichaeota bacterium]|nr:hypothetical protein [Calditrichota bacterium]